MAPWVVDVGGRIYRLHDIEQWTQKKRLATFPVRLHQRRVVHQFVRRKFHGLQQGLHWERIAWSRLKMAKFLAIKKREVRFLNLKIHDKRAPDNWSHMVRAKLASHFIISGKPIMSWKRVPDRKKLNYGFYKHHEVRSLLREVGQLGARGKARFHLQTEVQAAASCSCKSFFSRVLRPLLKIICSR